VGSKGDYLIPIARELWFRDSKDPVPPVGPGTGLPEWFTSQVEKTLSDGGLVLNASEDYLSREARDVSSAFGQLAAALERDRPPENGEIMELLARLRQAVDDLQTVRLVTEDAGQGD
jgi:hypothetical protein